MLRAVDRLVVKLDSGCKDGSRLLLLGFRVLEMKVRGIEISLFAL